MAVTGSTAQLRVTSERNQPEQSAGAGVHCGLAVGKATPGAAAASITPATTSSVTSVRLRRWIAHLLPQSTTAPGRR
jgi:hypothetical protein